MSGRVARKSQSHKERDHKHVHMGDKEKWQEWGNVGDRATLKWGEGIRNRKGERSREE